MSDSSMGRWAKSESEYRDRERAFWRDPLSFDNIARMILTQERAWRADPQAAAATREYDDYRDAGGAPYSKEGWRLGTAAQKLRHRAFCAMCRSGKAVQCPGWLMILSLRPDGTRVDSTPMDMPAWLAAELAAVREAARGGRSGGDESA